MTCFCRTGCPFSRPRAVRERCVYIDCMPPGWSRTTLCPSPGRSPFHDTMPGAMAHTGVPVGAAYAGDAQLEGGALLDGAPARARAGLAALHAKQRGLVAVTLEGAQPLLGIEAQRVRVTRAAGIAHARQRRLHLGGGGRGHAL